MTIITQCIECAHFIDNREFTCAAFKKKIPDAVLINEHDHRKPYPGDNGIRFRPKRAQAKKRI